jgi:transcriptional regulator GlxA family with amidase domain
LQRPDLSTSVVGVSFQCGFHNPGHFAKDYRSAFGELPSKTLMGAKRSGKTTR